jgi:hypothetical protein
MQVYSGLELVMKILIVESMGQKYELLGHFYRANEGAIAAIA